MDARQPTDNEASTPHFFNQQNAAQDRDAFHLLRANLNSAAACVGELRQTRACQQLYSYARSLF